MLKALAESGANGLAKSSYALYGELRHGVKSRIMEFSIAALYPIVNSKTTRTFPVFSSPKNLEIFRPEIRSLSCNLDFANDAS